MRGEMNCRYGNMNYILRDQCISYSVNADSLSNHNSRVLGIDLYNSGKIFPLNHLHSRNKHFTCDFTYQGIQNLKQTLYTSSTKELNVLYDFVIVEQDWHLSDHRPLYVDICSDENINSRILLRRATDLNYEFDPQSVQLTRYMGHYDLKRFENHILNNQRPQNLLRKNRLENMKNNLFSTIASSYSEFIVFMLNTQ